MFDWRKERKGREERGGEGTRWKGRRKIGKEEKNVQDTFKWPLQTASSRLHLTGAHTSYDWWQDLVASPWYFFLLKELCPFYSLIYHSWANIFPYISLSHLGVVVRKLRKCLYPIFPLLSLVPFGNTEIFQQWSYWVINIKLMLTINIK